MIRSSILFIFLVVFCFGFNNKNNQEAKTQLSIMQGDQIFLVDHPGQTLILKPKPFSLIFNTQHSNAVYLYASLDTIEYHKALNKEWDKLICFFSPTTFAEPSKNSDKYIAVNKPNHEGYHCLFALSDDPEFIRFDSVNVINPNQWIGIRTVNQVSILTLGSSTDVACDSLKGYKFYLNYSPGIEQKAECIKLVFQ
jgi:hypothetical protein